MKAGFARGCLAALIAAATAEFPLAADVELSRRHAWYRIEAIVFERAPDAADPGIARQRLLAPIVLPRMTAALAAMRPASDIAGARSLTLSNLAPPAWYAGECVLPDWSPPPNWSDIPGPAPRDPCLPAPDADAAATPAPPDAQDAAAPPNTLPEPPLRAARRLLAEAIAEHERALARSSYIWRDELPNLSAALRRVRARFDVLAAGSWHQPLPSRDAPERLLVQAGGESGSGRFALEGWFGVSLGRYVHFEAQLLRRVDSGFALLSETRPMRSGETHYLDHPALGILARVAQVPVPEELLDACPESISCKVAPRPTR